MELAVLIATLVWLILLSQTVEVYGGLSTLVHKVAPLLLAVGIAYVIFTGYVR